MFIARTETTSSNAEWIMSELIKNPEAMAKAQAGVQRAFDNKSPHDHEGHMEKLPYTKMVIKEGLRLHPPAPLPLPRLHVLANLCPSPACCPSLYREGLSWS